MSDTAIAAESASLTPLAEEVARRRTFAIISHPDAGKTTLTEKLLLFGGAINLAGQVKAKGERRNTRSDWMKIERDRGISVVTSVMTFEFQGHVFNLLDTPGHEDFSEDTYRTLTAVDSAVMVIDAAKGIEARTLKLIEVCRLRDIPIITFVNKMDRESRDTFDLLDEIEKTLALDTTPMTWPVGRGRDFIGTYDISTGGIRLLEGGGAKTGAAEKIEISDLAGRNANLDAGEIADELELVKEASKPFDLQSFREGHMTPVYFGSALRNFGVGDLLEGLGKFAPSPRAQEADKRKVEAEEARMSAFVFKIQANMDPNHRDRIAFARLCSGKLTRGMKAKLVRTGKNMSLSSPQFFFAQDRAIADEAFAGDVVGIPNHGTLRIGDTLTEGEDITFVGVPSFAPEILRRVRLTDAMKAKKLKEALQQMSEEGVVQVFRPRDGAPALVGVVGMLQLDVLKARLDAEYSLPVDFEISEFQLARWISSEDKKKLETFITANNSGVADDVDGDPVFLAKNEFYLGYTRERAEGIVFSSIKDVKKKA
ncbi:MAG TPA: peptide chain release factor 3 [Afipia sp.]|uniref:peptide chain release factor 3 n=1 Tax=unclassified Afipia TaxID=2642050 RepID=UPI0004673478|nr:MULTISPECIES: peptide chain release factor 3 [unclassified Afipia]MAH72308.1 peptide chain release factor 3 [Afipia sp.]OUX58601.1 MAG: peptide chain release factor 3 [Afipia sp. TMED4]HAO41597.1 peptide chain release factor 3 [Afipia sp.]HAP14215.1 peptide chain release factor 3 [Afipia sp.]HAQ93026.1 peptide chain release factor 3 [Afipia sp.]